MMTDMWKDVIEYESEVKRSLTEVTFPYQEQHQLHKECMFV